jgi:hypothetical protein
VGFVRVSLERLLDEVNDLNRLPVERFSVSFNSELNPATRNKLLRLVGEFREFRKLL